MASFVRKVPTASGARAVQIVHKQGRQVTGIEHIGSAHDEAQLGLLLEIARQRLHEGQQELDLPRPVASADAGKAASTPGGGVLGPRVTGSSSRLLWEMLLSAYARLGFDVLGDDAFRALVLARIIEPTSKADTIRLLEDLGVAGPSLRTIFRSMGRCVERDYRGRLSSAAAAFCARSQVASLVLYDVTTLHFEAENEDEGPGGLRKVGMSKERRVDPQIQVGLLVDPNGFPLEVHCFEGNKAETRTLLPVLEAFQARHGVSDLVVVADAGMLSAANPNAIEDAGYCFIVGSRITRAPYDLAAHFERHGNYFTDKQVLESTRSMGTGKAARDRRVVYQWTFKRQSTTTARSTPWSPGPRRSPTAPAR